MMRKILITGFILLTCMRGMGQLNDRLNENLNDIFLCSEDSLSHAYREGVYESIIKYPIIEEHKNSKRLWINSGIIIGASVASFGILYALPESFTNWDRDSMSFRSLGRDWKENVKAGPVWDKDDFFLNYVTHPYFGGVYYMSARTAGYSRFYSFMYSTLFSTCFWEYGIEAFAEVPSTQDLIVTPVAGSILGEGMYLLKKKIKSNHSRIAGKRWLGRTVLCLIDPLNEIQDSFIRGQERRAHKRELTVRSWIAPVGQGGVGMNVLVSF